MPSQRTLHLPTPAAALRALRLLVACVLMLAGALALVLHLLLLPNLPRLRPVLERVASHQLGVTVRIAQLRVSRPGWQPEIDMQGVALHGTSGRQALHIRQVRAVFSLQAAIRGGFESLHILQPHIQAHRFASGRIEVAGIPITPGKKSDSGPLLNWLLSQPELRIDNASLRWSDDQRRVPALDLTAVHASLHNQGSQHSLQLQATPPAGWGQTLQIIGQWAHPFWRDRTQWRYWQGTAYADMPALDVSQLRQYVDLGRHLDVHQGQGSLRLWAHFDAMRASWLTAEAHLRAVHVRLGADLPPLQLQHLDTLLSVQRRENAQGREQWALNAAQLEFATADGQHWPTGGNLQLELGGDMEQADSYGRLSGSHWDLGTIVALARRLPLGDAMLDMLDTYQPGGQLQQLELNWQGPVDRPTSFRANGQATGIRWQAQQGPFDARTGHFEPGVPGVEGADVRFQIQQDGGSMHIAMRNGAVTLPGIFAQPRVDFSELHAPVQWRMQGQHVLVQVQQAQLANPDLRGTLHARWHTSGAPPELLAALPGPHTLPRPDTRPGPAASRLEQVQQQARHTAPAASSTTAPPPLPDTYRLATRAAARAHALSTAQQPASASADSAYPYTPAQQASQAQQPDTPSSPYPGELELHATIASAQAGRVHRYLPLIIGDEARHYVRDAVLGGDIQQAQVHIAGPLLHLPAHTPEQARQSSFRFEVPLRHAHYRFIPPSLQTPGELPWPDLIDLDGTLVIDHNQLGIYQAQGRFSTAPDLRIRSLAAHIPHLDSHLAVGVSALAEGSHDPALHLTNTSPLSALAHDALQQATATGTARLHLTLGLPVLHMQHATVQGDLQLLGNDVRITPDTPLLGHSSGSIQFSQNGFALQQVRTHLLGGAATLSGGSHPGQGVRFTAEGEFSADGLRQEEVSLGTIARLARHMQGSSRYQATLRLDRGAPELTVHSSLQGLALQLPAPLHKTAASAMPLHLENSLLSTPGTDRLLARLGQTLSVEYVRDRQPTAAGQPPRVLRGSIGVGHDALQHMPPLPDADVHAYVRLDTVDADSWMRVLEDLSTPLPPPSTTTAPAATTTAGATRAGDAGNASSTSSPANPASTAPNQPAPTASQPSAIRTTPHTAAQPPVQAAATPNTPLSGQSTDTASAAQQYLPTIVAVLTPSLHIASRRIDQLVLAGTRQDRLWNFTLDARQLSGSVQYLQPREHSRSAGMIKARLERLLVEPATVRDVRDIVQKTQDPQSLPALDMRIRHLNILGYDISNVTLLASNSAQPQSDPSSDLDDTAEDASSRAWRIHELSAHAPHGYFSGNGLWALPAQGEPAASRRPVVLAVRLQTSNLGALLEHFRLPGLTSGGEGILSGTLRWRGSPIEPDLHALGGIVRADIRNGRVTAIDTSALRLLELLSLRSIGQMGSTQGKGFGYERVAGTIRIHKGIATSNNLHLSSTLADVRATGQASLPARTAQLDVLIQPQIDLGSPALLAAAVNPLLGAGSYLAQWLLSKAINHAAIQVLEVRGPWSQPQIEKLQGDTARQRAMDIQNRHTQLAHNNDVLWNWSPVTQPQRPRPATAASAPATPAAATPTGTHPSPAAPSTSTSPTPSVP